jgi:hypothetical protein
VELDVPPGPVAAVLVAPLRTTRSDDGAPGRHAAIAAAPYLADLGDLAPLTLRVALTRQPLADEASITPLLSAGLLLVQISAWVPDAALAAAARVVGERTENLFSHGGVIEIIDGSDGRLLGSAPLDTRNGASVEVHLSAADTQTVLDALAGGETAITVVVRAEQRSIDHQEVRLAGSWAPLFDRLSGRAIGGQVHRSDLELAVAAALRHGDLVLSTAPKLPPARVAPTAVAMVVSHRAALFSPTGSPTDASWTLRQRPSPLQALDIVEITNVGAASVAECSALLHALAKPVVDRFGLDALVQLSAAAPLSGHRVEPRSPRSPQRRERRDGDVAPLTLVGAGNFTSDLDVNPTTLLMGKAPDRGLASSLLGDGMPTHLDAGRIPWADKLGPLPGRRSGPLVVDVDAGVFPDVSAAQTLEARGGPSWWAPEFVLRLPAPGTAVPRDVFAMEIRRVGAGPQGQPVLIGRLTLRLTPIRPLAAAAAAPGMRQVDVSDLAVGVDVPFLDAAAGNALTFHQLSGTVTREGDDYIVTFDIADDWVRLLYGALSTPGFQSEPARLRVAYTFPGYRVAEILDPGAFRPIFATSFRPEVVTGLSSLTRGDLALVVRRDGPTDPLAGAALLGNLTLQPKLRPDLGLLATKPPRRPPTFLQTTFAHRRRHALAVPCADYPGAYLDITGAATPIGCRDSMRLGQIEYRPLIQRADLGTTHFAVWQETAQPSRYVVVPNEYRVSRRPPTGSTDDYRPAVLVRAALAPDPADVRIAVEFLLQPDIAPHALLDLLAAVRAEHSNAVLLWPNDLAGVDTTWSWLSLDSVTDRWVCSPLPDGHLALEAAVDVPRWSMLHAALQGTPPTGVQQVRLGDGTVLCSALSLDPRLATGPLATGPLTIAVRDGHATIANRLATSVRVASVIGYQAGQQQGATAVDSVLAGGGTITVPAPAGTRHECAYNVLRSDTVDLTEIRAFVEETQAQVLFSLGTRLAPLGLGAVEVEAELEGVPGRQTVRLDDADPNHERYFLLPLTAALADPKLRFRARSLSTQGATGPHGPWQLHDLASSALVIVTADHFTVRQ